jgi:branched-chain amino acid transport system ATP-binding protein
VTGMNHVTEMTEMTHTTDVSEPLLKVRGLSLRFQGVQALDDVSFDVAPGELLALIGPNGAGKTSVFNCITGVYRPQRGRVAFDGRDITGMRPHRVARRGLVRTFQNVQVFESMTVLDNLLLGRFNKSHTGVLAGALWSGPAVRDEIRQRRRVEEVVDFLEIQAIRDQPVGALPFGLQKRVELGRALAMEPKVLLLDEPVAGMNQEETEDMVRFVLDVKEELGITVVLVEHDMGVVMQISDRVCVLDLGQVVTVGSPAEVVRERAVREAYLGNASSLPPMPPLPPPAASLVHDGRSLRGIAHVVDLLVADLPLRDVLAACARLVPPNLGATAVVALLDGKTVVGSPTGCPSQQLSKDDRWWRPTLVDGRCRAPADFAGFPDDLVAQARAEGFDTVWVEPLHDASNGNDEMIGCLVVWVGEGVERTSETEELLRQTRRLASFAVREERRRSALRREAATDPLTGLGNRTALRRHLESAPAAVTLMLLDLDRFKPVNDTYGHAVGDAVLQVVAERLRRAVRETDLVVRLGGDEFVVLLVDGSGSEGAGDNGDGAPIDQRVDGMVDRIVTTIEAPIQLGDSLTITIGVSVGTATAASGEVVRLADAELYQAKRRKRALIPEPNGRGGRDGRGAG